VLIVDFSINQVIINKLKINKVKINYDTRKSGEKYK